MSSHTSSGSTDTYTTTPGGALISETISSGTYYYLWDGSGSVVGLTDSSGGVANTYAYDPMGNVTTTTGTTANPFTFQGMMYDSSNGFYYSGSGYYDPATGQAFGCKDVGHADNRASEDRCGEDEGSGNLLSVDPVGLVCNTRQPFVRVLGGKSHYIVYQFSGNCVGNPTSVAALTLKISWQRRGRKEWLPTLVTFAACNYMVTNGSLWDCPPQMAKYYLRNVGVYRLCITETLTEETTETKTGCQARAFFVR